MIYRGGPSFYPLLESQKNMKFNNVIGKRYTILYLHIVSHGINHGFVCLEMCVNGLKGGG